METKEGELKPCPFCGAKASLQHPGGDWFVTCDGLDCKLLPYTHYQRTREAAIAAWNTRANTRIADTGGANAIKANNDVSGRR